MVYAVLGFLLAWVSLPFWQGFFWGAVYGLLISLIPLLIVIYMLRTGKIKDLHISNKRQRRIPYFAAISGAAISFVLVRTLEGPPLLGSLALGNVIGLATLSAINQFWLISNHMASIVLGSLFVGIALGPLAGLAILPLVALVFFARLKLRRHTPAQLYAGIFVGIGTFAILCALGWL